MVPNVGEIRDALVAARWGGRSGRAVEFAEGFRADRVWAESWVPFLMDTFGPAI